MPSYREWKTAPVVAGGIYRKIYRRVGTQMLVEEATMEGTRQREDGTWEGMLKRFGYPPERVIEGTEGFAGWDLVARPQGLRSPIRSEERLSEKERLERENESLRKRLDASNLKPKTGRAREA